MKYFTLYMILIVYCSIMQNNIKDDFMLLDFQRLNFNSKLLKLLMNFYAKIFIYFFLNIFRKLSLINFIPMNKLEQRK